MTEQYAGALLYLVPVAVAAVVAFVVTRPEKPDPSASPIGPAGRSTDHAPAAARAAVIRPVRIPAQRSYEPPNRRAVPPAPPSPTLLHAALSSHFAAVAGAATATSAPASATRPVIRPSRLVSIRKPARIPRRPMHRCPHKP